MKKKLLSALLCVAMVSAMVVGCGSKAETPAATTPAETTPAETTAATTPAETTATTAATGDELIYLVSKGFQHQFWQAVYQGAQEAADELGVKMEMVGPNTESDIADQVQMLNNAINLKPTAIGLAALDTEACLEGIKTAMDSKIPIIGFDSGVPGAPEGAIYANASTDNYAAGMLAADNTYPLIKEAITGATGTVRIGVMSQDATSESITGRGFGFVDQMKKLVEADGKKVSVEGHDKFMEKSGGKVDGADVIIEVAVPAQVTAELSSIDAQTFLNKKDTICIYASNQHSSEGLVNGDANIGKLGKEIVGIGFDSGVLLKTAVKEGKIAGAVTQDPLNIGRLTVKLAYAAAHGETVENVDTGCQWYSAANMEDPGIAPNLYD